MVVFRWRTSLSGAALLILGVCGCAGPESSEGALAPAASVTVEETFSSPPPEPSVSESTATPDGDETPRLSLPRLPIGGAAAPDPDTGRQCVEISWIATINGEQTFPSGYAVEITRAWFSDKGFEVVRSGCGHGPPNCLGHIVRSGSPTCALAVRALPRADPGRSVSVGLKGVAYCPNSVGRTGCQRFVESLGKQQPQHSIPLLPAPEQTPPTDSSTTPETGADGEPSGGPDPAATATPPGG